MARRGTAVAESDTENTEAVVETTEDSTTEAPAASTEDSTPDTDLSAFTEAVAAAVAGRDESTGEVPTALIEPVQKAYRDLDGLKAKNAAKRLLTDGVKDGMNQLNIGLARANMTLSDSLGSAAAHKAPSEKAPVDPTEAFVAHLAALRLAGDLVAGVVPEGVDVTEALGKVETEVSEATESAQAYLAWFTGNPDERGDEPDASALVKSAVKLSQGKAARVAKSSGGGSTYSGERRNIGKHILEAFADKASGDFLTIAEIRSHKSSEYGDDAPSAGAISARLFPASGKCSLEGVTPDTDENGKKGARKA